MAAARLRPGWGRARALLVSAVLGLTLAMLGCSYGISVRRVGTTDLTSDWRDSAVEADEVSPRTRETLHRLDLDSEYAHHPLQAFHHLEEMTATDTQPDMLFALAEMSYVFGRQAEKMEDPEACADYYLCAGYAYHYLFDDSTPAAPAPTTASPFDPRFRLACDLYNTALAKCIRAAQRSGRLDPRQRLQLPTPDGKGFLLSVVHHGFPWPPEDFGPLLFSADYEVVGLTNHYHTYGLGTALIGTRVAGAGHDRTATGQPTVLRFPREVSFPVSAFFRFEGSVADLRARRAGRLELYNPLTVQTVEIGNRVVPLEMDLTTPLAYFLSRTDLEGIELPGLLQGDRIQDRTGIYTFEPYQPGKIPVVMVHGLWASPLTWTAMFNDLRADPYLRQHFQFWFYLYPTGNPYLQSAADLRATLTRLRRQIDPEHRDAALDQMVFVAHSMGGLVSRLLVEDSGDDFWRLISRQPFDTLKLKPQTRAELARFFFFRPQSCVRRIVFIATPHHGSKLAPSPAGQLVAQFIRMPQALAQAFHDVAKEDPQVAPGLNDGAIASSLDMLAPGAPALELLAAKPKPADVRFHSIIGITSGSGVDGGDGIVSYRSAHIDGVDSELIVPAGHSTIHQHPRTVAEVRRILLEHLREVYAGRTAGGPAVAPAVSPVLAN